MTHLGDEILDSLNDPRVCEDEFETFWKHIRESLPYLPPGLERKVAKEIYKIGWGRSRRVLIETIEKAEKEATE